MKRENDTAFQMGASNLRFGRGTTREVGMDLADMGIERVLVITDPNLVNLPPVQTAREALEAAGIAYHVFDRVRVEPTDISFKEAIEVATEGQYEGYVAIGGGSSMDTAKAANLFATYPDDFFAYINAPIGRGKPVPGPVKPLIAIPTTAGTGSETTGVAIMDLSDRHVKTGIAHRHLKPRPRDCRSRKHAHHALCNRSGHWPGCAVPRLGVVHRPTLYRASHAPTTD